jgi:SAM-dependent methyltransferase
VSNSIPFDRAVPYYDRTRSLTPEAMAQVVEILVGALADHQPVLEVGVGTGRVAVPLSEAGLDVYGVDLSGPMLGELRAKRATLPVGRADCTRLPFPDQRFGGVVASHVFHLVPDWRRAADEALRVLRPGGVLLYARGGLGGRGEEVSIVFGDAAGIDRVPVGLDAVEDLDAHLGEGEWLTEVVDDRRISIDDMITMLEAGVMGWTWVASEEARAAAAVETRRWAAERYERTEEPLPVARPVRFRRYAA